MEVLIPIHQQNHMDDFDFNSARSSPCPTTPSTPRGFGSYYTSAPTTPSRLSEFYQEFHDFTITNNVNDDGKVSYYYDDFAFDAINEEMNNNEVVSAEDLFEGGIIKPMTINQPMNKTPFLSPRENSRGRERSLSSSSSSRKRETRSLSPLRVSESAWEVKEDDHHHEKTSIVAKPSKNRRKWRLKDFFLFRSASEGRADQKDFLKKKSHLPHKPRSFWK